MKRFLNIQSLIWCSKIYYSIVEEETIVKRFLKKQYFGWSTKTGFCKTKEMFVLLHVNVTDIMHWISGKRNEEGSLYCVWRKRYCKGGSLYRSIWERVGLKLLGLFFRVYRACVAVLSLHIPLFVLFYRICKDMRTTCAMCKDWTGMISDAACRIELKALYKVRPMSAGCSKSRAVGSKMLLVRRNRQKVIR